MMTTSGKLLAAIAELSDAARLPESDDGSRCVQPLSVAMKTMTTLNRALARRMIHYLVVPYALYE